MTDIVLETIESYNEYLNKLPSGCIAIAKKFREDQIQAALLNVKDFSEGVIWLSEVSELLKKNSVNVESNIEKIHEFLTEINDALQIRDYHLVADLFEYEIAEFFEQCKKIVREQ
ncbi:hypothetical protein [Lysinibacillus telephonicus]|uniref:DUF8042 domain-containing protein n=1 Tax=Lysinibacillus telephonicus TaxID=1714840 RepID=A0A431UUP5_9BACI|nr:hypothetical protein [Lysinibacillus telephonicus]RTQ94294.1 hypothetical protein EKG35_05930 [Lysinibacillus telephonicus]